MADEEAVAPVTAKIGEHEVSILLSYMDDEHEKAAIEVRLGAPRYEPHPTDPPLTNSQMFWVLRGFARHPLGDRVIQPVLHARALNKLHLHPTRSSRVADVLVQSDPALLLIRILGGEMSILLLLSSISSA